MSPPLLEIEGLTKHFPVTTALFPRKKVAWVKAVDGIDFARRRRRNARGHRRIRLRQDDDLEADPVAGEPDRRHDPLRRAGHRRACRAGADALPARGPGRVPGPVQLALPAHAGRRDHRRAVADPHRHVARTSSASGSPRCSTWSGCDRKWRGSSRTNSPAGSASASRSPAPSSPIPASSCSTSRSRALDVSIRAQIMNQLEELQERLGVSYLFIGHDLATVAHISHRIAVMYLGQIVELADALELCDEPLHPYTQALFTAALPAHPDEKRERLTITRRGAERARAAIGLPLSPALPAGDGALRGRGAGPQGSRAAATASPATYIEGSHEAIRVPCGHRADGNVRRLPGRQTRPDRANRIVMGFAPSAHRGGRKAGYHPTEPSFAIPSARSVKGAVVGHHPLLTSGMGCDEPTGLPGRRAEIGSTTRRCRSERPRGWTVMGSGHHLKSPKERANLAAPGEAARSAHSGRISDAATARDRRRRDATAVDHRGVCRRCRQGRTDRLLHRRVRDLGQPVPAGGRGLSGAPRQHRQGAGRRGDRNPVRLPGRGEPGSRQGQATSRRADPARSRQVPLPVSNCRPTRWRSPISRKRPRCRWSS